MDFSMDEDVSLWIIDFLLRQQLHDRIMDKLLRVLPLSIHDSSLKKSILVRKIVSVISKGIASEEILILMESIEELDYQAGITASEAMKAAYCDVAVDCTIRLLEESQDRKEKYYDAVKRIWRERVLKMEMTGNVGLVSDVLLTWRDDIEASVWNFSFDEDLLKKWRDCEALESVKVYVAEAWAAMGPSFLEHVVQTIGNEQITQVLEHSTCPVYDQDLNSVEVQSSSAEMEKRGRGEISDSDSQDGRAASEKGFTFTPEVKKMQKALRDSCRDLQAVVVDPLPEAIQLADKIISSLPVNNLNPSCPMDIENTAKSDEAIDVNETQNNISRKPSLMERNSTARVHEWDESLDDAVDESSDGNRLHLPSPSKRRVSPLKILEMENLGKRKKRRWSIVEEDTLRAGVEKYGKGNWKFILNAYRDILVERTEVDLKDKWRNMTR